MAFDVTSDYTGEYSGSSWAGSTSTNDAARPEFWANVMQANLTKNLVSMDIASTSLESQLTKGDTLNMPYFDQPSSTSYSPGDSVSYKNLGASDDALKVNKAEYVALEIDDIQKIQSKYGQQRFRDAIVTPLKETFDESILGHAVPDYYNGSTILDKTMDGQPNKVITSGLTVVNESDISDDTETPLDLDATGDYVYKMISKAKKVLREADADLENLFAVFPPRVQEVAENTLVGKGYQVADETVRNGRVGKLMGIDIYGTNNHRVIPAANLSVSNDAFPVLVGQKGAVNVVSQAKPDVSMIETPEDSFSTLFKAKQVWGSKVFNNDQDRLVSILVEDK